MLVVGKCESRGLLGKKGLGEGVEGDGAKRVFEI